APASTAARPDQAKTANPGERQQPIPKLDRASSWGRHGQERRHAPPSLGVAAFPWRSAENPVLATPTTFEFAGTRPTEHSRPRPRPGPALPELRYEAARKPRVQSYRWFQAQRQPRRESPAAF